MIDETTGAFLMCYMAGELTIKLIGNKTANVNVKNCSLLTATTTTHFGDVLLGNIIFLFLLFSMCNSLCRR